MTNTIDPVRKLIRILALALLTMVLIGSLSSCATLPDKSDAHVYDAVTKIGKSLTLSEAGAIRFHGNHGSNKVLGDRPTREYIIEGSGSYAAVVSKVESLGFVKDGESSWTKTVHNSSGDFDENVRIFAAEPGNSITTASNEVYKLSSGGAHIGISVSPSAKN